MTLLRWSGIILLTLIGFQFLGAEDKPATPALEPLPRIAPTEPADVGSTFRVQQGFQLDLLAAEPLTTDPVAIEYDENGRAFVAEMSDYPYTDKSTDKPFVERTTDLPIGRVRILEDLDDDGKFDRSTVFAEGLSWPTGLAFWKGGVFVAATPDIWYFKDTDGDRKADLRRKVYTGFKKFNVQAVMNNLKWGLDHQLYGAGSSNGGTIQHLDHPNAKPLVLGRNDFRIDPNSEQMALVSGGARFGNAFDDWGNRFLCNIRNPVQHVVLPLHYLARNPLLSVPATVNDAAPAGDTLPVFRISPPEPWRVMRARRWVAESGQNYPRSETYADGYFTSSSGITIYRGTAYPPEFYGNAFVGEVAANAIHRQIVEPNGVTFSARRANEKVEFAASTDNWFRPVNFVNAPDGTLHVLDMYRETIEHPWSIPDDIKALVDLESGRDRGRIYRLTPPGFQRPAAPRLGAATAEQLVQALRHGDSWWRETAHRLIYERQDVAAVPLLRQLLREPAIKPTDDPRSIVAARTADATRLHALWSLVGLKSLEDADLSVVLSDPSSHVREHAVRLAEPRLNQSSDLRAKVLQLATDPAVRVRFQVAFTCGEITAPDAQSAVRDALVAIASRDAEDPWVRTAILSSSATRAEDLAEALLQTPGTESPAIVAIRELALFAAARNQPDGIEHLLRVLLKLESDPQASMAANGRILRLAAVAGVIDGMKRLGKPLSAKSLVGDSTLAHVLSVVLNRTAESLANPDTPSAEKLLAISLQSLREPPLARETLVGLLEIHEAPEVQLAAVRALAALPIADIPQYLLTRYRGFSPGLQAEVVDALLSRPERIPMLFEAIENRAVLASQVSAARRNLLLKHADEKIRTRATKLFAQDVPSPRHEVLQAYRAALKLTPDQDRGLVVLRRECLTCHRWRDQGQDVAPNLETIRNRTADEILVNVLDPNREVSPNYVEYVVVLKDGRNTSGVIVAETGGSITVRKPEGRQEVILRQDIDELSSSGKSLMPEGLEQKVTPQEMADLLAQLLGKQEATPTKQ